MSWSITKTLNSGLNSAYNGSVRAYNTTSKAAASGYNTTRKAVASGLNKTRKAFASLPSYVTKLSTSAIIYASNFRSFFKLRPTIMNDIYKKIYDIYANVQPGNIKQVAKMGNILLTKPLPENVRQKIKEVCANAPQLTPEENAILNNAIEKSMESAAFSFPVAGAGTTVAADVLAETGAPTLTDTESALLEKANPPNGELVAVAGGRKKGGAENPLHEESSSQEDPDYFNSQSSTKEHLIVSFPEGPLGIDIAWRVRDGRIVVIKSAGFAFSSGVEVGDLMVRVGDEELLPKLQDVSGDEKCNEVKKIIEILPRPLEVLFEKGDAQQKASGQLQEESNTEKIAESTDNVNMGVCYLTSMLCILASANVLTVDWTGISFILLSMLCLDLFMPKKKKAGGTRKRRRLRKRLSSR